jgi:hypothetical protein
MRFHAQAYMKLLVADSQGTIFDHLARSGCTERHGLAARASVKRVAGVAVSGFALALSSGSKACGL